MKITTWIARLAMVTLALAAFGCADNDNENNETNNVADAGDLSEDTSGSDTDGEDAETDTAPQEVTWAEVSAIFEARNCKNCHADVTDTYRSVVDEWIEGPRGNVLEEKMEINHRVNAADAQVVLDWLEQGYPEE
ncbi:MAG: hypothetical protein ACQEVA_04295 [Myxococcota bacterium]